MQTPYAEDELTRPKFEISLHKKYTYIKTKYASFRTYRSNNRMFMSQNKVKIRRVNSFSALTMQLHYLVSIPGAEDELTRPIFFLVQKQLLVEPYHVI